MRYTLECRGITLKEGAELADILKGIESVDEVKLRVSTHDEHHTRLINASIPHFNVIISTVGGVLGTKVIETVYKQSGAEDVVKAAVDFLKKLGRRPKPYSPQIRAYGPEGEMFLDEPKGDTQLQMEHRKIKGGMREVRGILFDEEIADTVEELANRIEAKVGRTHQFSSPRHFGVKFALRLPDESKGKYKKARGLFIQIASRSKGALAIRPRIPKSDWSTMELTKDTVDEVFRAGMSWYYQVQKMKIPDEYQLTDNWLTFAGGRYESNKRKF